MSKRDERSRCKTSNSCLVTLAKGSHPFPYRTRKLSPSAPMVLPFGGRVGRRQAFFCVLTKITPTTSGPRAACREPSFFLPGRRVLCIKLFPINLCREVVRMGFIAVRNLHVCILASRALHFGQLCCAYGDERAKSGYCISRSVYER